MPLFLLFDFIILLLIRFFVKIFITIFGWATDIFFGKLPEKNRLWFYLMIVLSFIWIYCLLAKAFPIMFYIFKDYVPENSLTSIFKRILYILCVVAIPPGVGALGAFIKGIDKSNKKRFYEWLLKGYRYSLVLGCSMAVILVCTPVIRIKRILKREISKSMNMKVAGNGNIYVMNEISKALMKSGIKTVKKVPSKVYSLPTKMINGIVKDLFDYVSDREFYVSGENISIYINSADIMLEGKKELVEKVQTAIVKGFVVNNIYLTNDDKSRKIEREINSIWLKWTAEEISSEEAAVRLIKLTNQSFEEDMSYDERALLSVQLNEVQNEILIKRQKDLGISK
ncbi:MAG: hypothetical protein EGQ35_05400 [Clostridiales bacterium]|nr:hypothetical protein [Clostridiales bacterium]